MPDQQPVIVLLYGEDEFAISQIVDQLVKEQGDPAMADLNILRLEGKSLSLEDLENAVSSLPFLASRRLVIVTNPLARLTTPGVQEKFKALLEKVPSSALLVLIEYRALTDQRDRKHGKVHWLEKWALGAGQRVSLRPCPLPQGTEMIQQIHGQAKAAGGDISKEAAVLLASLVGNYPRISSLEIEKLLAYVNYRRRIEYDDVLHLTADQGQGDIFNMVDAIGQHNAKQAMDNLHRLLGTQDPLSLFGMVNRQFRLLLLAKEILDQRGTVKDVAQRLKLHPFVAEKISKQARNFSLPLLETIYHTLLDLDTAIKSSDFDEALALDLLIATVAS